MFVQGRVPGGRRKPENESLEVKAKSPGDAAVRTCDQIAEEGIIRNLRRKAKGLHRPQGFYYSFSPSEAPGQR